MPTPTRRERPWTVLSRAWGGISSDRVALSAAGCAFWATLALFPAISMLISIYGMLFDPTTVEPQLDLLRNLLPPEGFALIAGRVHTLVSHGRAELGLSLLIGTAVALWSASTGTKSMLSALNVAFDNHERRGFLRFQAVGLLMTFGGIVAATVGLALLVLLPAAIDFVGLDAYARSLIRAGSYGGLVVFIASGLSLLYRFGPARRPPGWRWFSAGALVATLFWLVASGLLSYYVANVASYDATYGPLGAVAGIMMWFWVSAYAVLLGAELDNALAAPAGGAH
jgi:membrane protein